MPQKVFQKKYKINFSIGFLKKNVDNKNILHLVKECDTNEDKQKIDQIGVAVAIAGDLSNSWQFYT